MNSIIDIITWIGNIVFMNPIIDIIAWIGDIIEKQWAHQFYGRG